MNITNIPGVSNFIKNFISWSLALVIIMKFKHCEEWVDFWKASGQTDTRKYDQEEWVKDGSLDVKRRPVLRTKSGGWKAASFILGR